jgi:hypothetical protein
MYYFTDKQSKHFYALLRKYVGKQQKKATFSCEEDQYMNIGGVILPRKQYMDYTEDIYKWAYASLVNSLDNWDFVEELSADIRSLLETEGYEIKNYKRFRLDVLYFLYRISS